VDVVTTNIPGQSNSTTTTNTSDSGIQSFGSTWKLVELKNKEIKFTTTSEYTYVNNAGVSSTSKSNSNFTLTAK
jgi:hypothetical protein